MKSCGAGGFGVNSGWSGVKNVCAGRGVLRFGGRGGVGRRRDDGGERRKHLVDTQPLARVVEPLELGSERGRAAAAECLVKVCQRLGMSLGCVEAQRLHPQRAELPRAVGGA